MGTSTTPRSRTNRRLAGALVALALTAAACAAPPEASPATRTYRIQANKVTVVNHNDTFLYGVRDEPYVLQLWFRVKVGVPGSAQVGLTGSRANAINDLGNGESRALVGAQQAAVDFAGVAPRDVLDLADPAKPLEVLGSWVWAMERDDVDVSGVADSTLTILRNTLNQVVAAGSIPSDPNQLVGAILGDFGTVFNLVAGSLFSSIPGIPDDAIGSRFLIGIAATGTLSSIIDQTAGTVAFPTVAIPVVTVPPDIGGGRIFSLGSNRSYLGEVFDQGDGRHLYDLSVVDTATIPKPPVASVSASVTSGPAPLAVTLNGSASTDPDGTIVAYNWNFGDFTTGSGAIVTKTFTTAGTFPVTLTVTDNSGLSHSATTTISVGGAPTVAPTGLTKVGAGCCDTYGDFSWNQVPGATAYQINMGAFFGGGCLSSHSATIPAPAAFGRVQAFGLCLGSQYDVTIRAQANGLWGPWSPAVRITL